MEDYSDAGNSNIPKRSSKMFPLTIISHHKKNGEYSIIRYFEREETTFT